MCCMQVVSWRGQGTRMLGMKGRRYKLWWSGKEDGVCGVGVMVNQELCELVVEVGRVIDSGDSCCCFLIGCAKVDLWVWSAKWIFWDENQPFCDELKGEWDMHSAGDLVICLGDFNGFLGGHIDGFDGVPEGMALLIGILKEECY